MDDSHDTAVLVKGRSVTSVNDSSLCDVPSKGSGEIQTYPWEGQMDLCHMSKTCYCTIQFSCS